MFYYYVTKVLPVEGDELHVGEMYPEGGSGEILSIMAITEPTENGESEEFDLIITRHHDVPFEINDAALPMHLQRQQDAEEMVRHKKNKAVSKAVGLGNK